MVISAGGRGLRQILHVVILLVGLLEKQKKIFISKRIAIF